MADTTESFHTLTSYIFEVINHNSSLYIIIKKQHSILYLLRYRYPLKKLTYHSRNSMKQRRYLINN